MIDQTRQTYFSPDDETIQPFLTFLKSAKKSIRLADYSFNMQPVVDILAQKVKDGVDVKCVLDKTQAAGPSERPIIEGMRKGQVPMMIGTSDQHKIMHDKFCIVDEEWVQCGSWNYTATAAKEDNFYFIEHNPALAKAFLKSWQKMWDWIGVHEPQ